MFDIDRATAMIFAMLRLVYITVKTAIFLLLITGIFVHQPTFWLLYNGLLYMHLVARFLYLYIRIQYRYAMADPTKLATWFASYSRDILVFLAPVLRPAMTWITGMSTKLVQLSPRVLCSVNGGVVKAGQFVVEVVMEGNAGDLMDMWKDAGKDVARFCKVV